MGCVHISLLVYAARISTSTSACDLARWRGDWLVFMNKRHNCDRMIYDLLTPQSHPLLPFLFFFLLKIYICDMSLKTDDQFRLVCCGQGHRDLSFSVFLPPRPVLIYRARRGAQSHFSNCFYKVPFSHGIFSAHSLSSPLQHLSSTPAVKNTCM